MYYKNRIELAPPGCGGGGDDNGFVTPSVVEYFKPFAQGGATIISVGNCSIDIAFSWSEIASRLTRFAAQ